MSIRSRCSDRLRAGRRSVPGVPSHHIISFEIGQAYRLAARVVETVVVVFHGHGRVPVVVVAHVHHDRLGLGLVLGRLDVHGLCEFGLVGARIERLRRGRRGDRHPVPGGLRVAGPAAVDHVQGAGDGGIVDIELGQVVSYVGGGALGEGHAFRVGIGRRDGIARVESRPGLDGAEVGIGDALLERPAGSVVDPTSPHGKVLELVVLEVPDEMVREACLHGLVTAVQHRRDQPVHGEPELVLEHVQGEDDPVVLGPAKLVFADVYNVIVADGRPQPQHDVETVGQLSERLPAVPPYLEGHLVDVAKQLLPEEWRHGLLVVVERVVELAEAGARLVVQKVLALALHQLQEPARRPALREGVGDRLGKRIRQGFAEFQVRFEKSRINIRSAVDRLADGLQTFPLRHRPGKRIKAARGSETIEQLLDSLGKGPAGKIDRVEWVVAIVATLAEGPRVARTLAARRGIFVGKVDGELVDHDLERGNQDVGDPKAQCERE